MPSKITGGILEKDIQKQICEWLEQNNFFFWRNNTVGLYNPRKKLFMAMPKYSVAGLPDIMIINRGRLIGLEVKRPTHRGSSAVTTDNQNKVKIKFLTNGAFYFLVTSLEEAITSMGEIA